MKRSTRTIVWVAGLLLLATIPAALIWHISLAPYKTPLSKAYLAKEEALQFFARNTDNHPDPLQGCWYDAGDYLVFTPRTAEALWYLSLAYKASDTPRQKQALLATMSPALDCVVAMDKASYKQFRDARSHASRLPPFLHRFLTPQTVYSYAPGEGRDVAAFLSLTYKNLGDMKASDSWKTTALSRTSVTTSKACCEGGPLMLTPEEMQALEWLAGIGPAPSYDSHALWGAQLTSIAELEIGDSSRLARVFAYVEKTFTDAADDFAYLGGNYDIAGTILAIHLYEQKTGDVSYAPLAVHLQAYLKGQNAAGRDFTHLGSDIYHVCGWYRACDLPETLVNGVDESGSFDLSRHDVWRIAEVQTVGQAIYAASRLLSPEEY